MPTDSQSVRSGPRESGIGQWGPNNLLDWLIQLRWAALLSVSISGLAGTAGLVPGIDVHIIALAVLLGVITNLAVSSKRSRRQPRWSLHQNQAILDTGALTLVIWAAGGAQCPFLAFYVFPLLLAALLGGARALWVTGSVSALGLSFQVMVTYTPELQVGVWNPVQPFDVILNVIAVIFTVAMAAYFASRLTNAFRQQVDARQEADAVVRVAFMGLGAALEVLRAERIVWQNKSAENLFGNRTGHPWTCPEHGDGPCPPMPDPVVGLSESHCRFSMPGPNESSLHFEYLCFPIVDTDRRVAVYLDRTHEVAHRRHLMLTERLASLGRTVHGVAHELNTPLATIQTLGQDLNDAIGESSMDDAIRNDLEESAQMIVSEVKRCRRITHALLGRAEPTGGSEGSIATITESLERALTVVFTQDRRRVQLDLSAIETVRYPFDPMVQIFVNLLQNARDAAPEGRVNVFGTLEEEIKIHVVDEGSGLTTMAMEHLFEPFFTTKPPGQGTGLGLYTSSALARTLGGKLELQNQNGAGVRATLTLPFMESPSG